MHVKCPDDIGRVAGTGDTLGWRELKEFRGTDIARRSVGWHHAGSSGSAPSKIIVVVVVVVVVVI